MKPNEVIIELEDGWTIRHLDGGYWYVCSPDGRAVRTPGFVTRKGAIDGYPKERHLYEWEIDSIRKAMEAKPNDEYLNEKIEAATETWKGVDTEKFMDELRYGKEPDDVILKCSKCGVIDDSGLTPRTSSALCNPHQWQLVKRHPVKPNDEKNTAAMKESERLRLITKAERFRKTRPGIWSPAENMADFHLAEVALALTERQRGLIELRDECKRIYTVYAGSPEQIAEEFIQLVHEYIGEI